MRRLLFGLAVALLMGTARAAFAGCAASDAALCLNASRFTASVHWQDANGRTGDGHAIAITADTGYFWFFTPSNIELVVKVLDARTVNGKYWVFFGALSNVQYTLTVTDTATGAQKQYVNPLGQFASVGDTKAFNPNGPAGARAVVERVEGTFAPPESLAAVQRRIDAAASAKPEDAPAPCTTFRSSLRLGSCRFAVDVTWTDSQGRTGRGTPIPLTSDTGYFWFFSPSNVELMVKVLDARSVNGNFWVFYGALTDVQFTLTVTDSLTGAYKVYTNPVRTFASVGDTRAFAAGKSVGPVLDAARAAFADFDSAGGSLSATAADGTQFELLLPPDALPTQTTIRMTPLSSVQGLPLSKGFLGGVHLEPEGLTLFMPATLTIRSPGNLHPQAAAFSYRGRGDEFALDVNQVNGKEMTLQILHFSGYGGGNPGPSDPFSTTLLNSATALRQQAMEIIERGREHEDDEGNVTPPELTPVEVHAQLQQLLENFYLNIVYPLFDLARTDCNESRIRALAELVLATQRVAQFIGLSDEPGVEVYENGAISQMIDLLHHCIEVAFNDCVAYKDPYKVWLMALLNRQLELFGAATDAETFMAPGSFPERCLRFRMDFDSTIAESGPNLTTTYHVATGGDGIKFRLGSQSVRDISWVGQGPLNYVQASGSFTPGTADNCTRSFMTTGSTFDVETDSRYALILPLLDRPEFFDPMNPNNTDVKMIYDPGEPMETEIDVCTTSEGTGARTVGPFTLWSFDYLSLHGPLGEFLGSGVGFLAKDWDTNGAASLFAEKIYTNSLVSGSVTLNEQTKFTIYHTPDAP